MHIVGLGMDATEVDRIAASLDRYGDRFLQRVFTDGEIAYCMRRRNPAPHLAGRFAAKEAGMKAIGTGHAFGVLWRDLEVVRQSGSAPELALHGVAAELARAKGIARIHITITHDAGIAAAVAVAEG